MTNELKKGIDYIGISVVYFCHDGNGRFIMAKRSNNTRDEHGRWDIGGGGIEFEDTVEDTLRKEIREEYCADVLAFKFLGHRDVHREYQNHKTHWIALDFKVQVDSKQVQNGEPDMFDEVAWFTWDSIPENIHSQLHHFFEIYREELSK